MLYRKIFVTSDMHFPYEHPDTLEFLRDVCELHDWDFDLHLELGDIIDSHAFSNWDKRPDLHGASREMSEARDKIQALVELLDFPHLGVIGNHCDRIRRKSLANGIPEEVLRPLEEIYGLPWKLEESLTIQLDVGEAKPRELYVIHNGGSDLRKEVVRNNTNMVAGHYHYTSWIDYQVTGNDLVWGLQMPCLIDRFSPAFAYARRQIKKPIIGCAIIEWGVPKLVMMPLDKNGRYKPEELIA